MNRNIIIAFLLIILSQVLAYFQLQSQFFWKYPKDHPFIMALFGFPISILLIFFTKYCTLAFNGEVWPGRLIGFAVGAIVFAVLSSITMSEPLTSKTIICLLLAGSILAVQLFYK